MSHKVSYKWIRKTQVIPELGLDYNVWGVFDFEVFLGGVCFRGGYCFVPDESYLIRKMSIPPEYVFPSNPPSDPP